MCGRIVRWKMCGMRLLWGYRDGGKVCGWGIVLRMELMDGVEGRSGEKACGWVGGVWWRGPVVQQARQDVAGEP